MAPPRKQAKKVAPLSLRQQDRRVAWLLVISSVDHHRGDYAATHFDNSIFELL